MVYLVTRNQTLTEFKILLAHQNDIKNLENYYDYSTISLYSEISIILRKDASYQKQIYLKRVCTFN